MENFNRFIKNLGIGLMDADIVAPDISAQLRIFSYAGNTVQVSKPVIINNQWKMIRSVDALMVNIAIRIERHYMLLLTRGLEGLKIHQLFL